MRNPYFDNLKFVLIFFVVLGHFLLRYRDDSVWLNGLNLFIYLFHMPLFAMVSGYFSKRFSPQLKEIAFILIPYVAFQVLYIGYYKLLGLTGEGWSGAISFTKPFEHNWYLLSLFGWRLMSLYAKQCRFAVLLAFILALIAGMEPSLGWEYSASRTICFFPFFLLGMKADENSFRKLARFKVWAVLVLSALFVGSMWLAWCRPNTANLIAWISFYAESYAQTGGWIKGGVYRVGMYGLSLISGIAVLALIPWKKCGFTSMGERTMTIYFWHNFFVFGLRKIYPDYQPVMGGLIIFTSAIGTTLLLARKEVHTVLSFPFVALNKCLEGVKPETDH